MGPTVERASSVAKFVELENIALRGASLSTHLLGGAAPDALDVQSRYRARGELLGSEPARIHAILDFEFEGRSADQSADIPVIRLEATFELVYLLKPGAEYPEGAVSDFAHFNGAYNAWPYWRELVQSVSGRVGLAGIVIPVFRAQDVVQARFATSADQSSQPATTESTRDQAATNR